MQFSKWITLGFGALCLVAVAGVLRAQHLYYMAAILLTLPGVSYLLGWYALRGLDFVREIPSNAWEGEVGALSYAVTNRTRFSRFFLSIHESLPEWIAPQDVEPPLFNAPGGDVTQVSHPVTFKRRGVYRVHAFDVTAMDPLGVFAFSRRVPADSELVVYPLPRPLSGTPVSGAERYGWQEFMSVALRGSGVDPDGVRPYTPGDPLRRIHWRQTARTNRLAVIEFEEPQAVNLAIALDTQRGTEVGSGTETTLEYGVRLAASVTDQALRQGACVRFIAAVDDGAEPDFRSIFVDASHIGRGQEQYYRILDALARVEADADRAVSTVIANWSVEIPRGMSMLVITAQADPELPSAVAALTGQGMRVTVVYVDPASFVSARTLASQSKSKEFLADLVGVGANVFSLARHPDGDLVPEEIQNAIVRA
jgi:uncharacterized protein (DUF58 family)